MFRPLLHFVSFAVTHSWLSERGFQRPSTMLSIVKTDITFVFLSYLHESNSFDELREPPPFQ